MCKYLHNYFNKKCNFYVEKHIFSCISCLFWVDINKKKRELSSRTAPLAYKII